MLVLRHEWGARPPARAPQKMREIRGLVVHWEGVTLGPFDHHECAGRVRAVQRFHIESRNMTDIAYNFCVCPHGAMFVGRGPGIINGANGTKLDNATDEAVCYLGGPGDVLTIAAKDALRALVVELKPDRVRSHRQVKPTQCPGDELHEFVQDVLRQPVPSAPDPDEDDMFSEEDRALLQATAEKVSIIEQNVTIADLDDPDGPGPEQGKSLRWAVHHALVMLRQLVAKP